MEYTLSPIINKKKKTRSKSLHPLSICCSKMLLYPWKVPPPPQKFFNSIAGQPAAINKKPLKYS